MVKSAPQIAYLHSNRRSAFTIIELLVVITIITVLVSLVMPAVSRTKREFNILTCENNLRQISSATISYAQANNASYPFSAPGPANSEDWVYWEPGRNLNSGGIVPYLATVNPAKVLICPADDAETHLGWPSFWYPFSYSMNINIGGYYPGGDAAACYPGLPNRSMRQIKNAQNCILYIHESETTIDDGCWAWQSAFGSWRNLMSAMHDQTNRELANDPSNPTAGRGTAAFCDGHTAFISRGDSWNSLYYDPTK